MSLLADLLSKAKDESTDKNTVVPPHLESIIMRASGKKKHQTRFIIIGAIVVVMVIIGFGAVHYMNAFFKPAVKLQVSSFPGRTIPVGQPPKDGLSPAAQPAASGQPETENPKSAPPPSSVRTEESKRITETHAQGLKAGTREGQKSARPETIEEPVVDVKPVKKAVQEKADSEMIRQKPVEPVKYEKQHRVSVTERRKADRDAAIYSARNYEESGNLPQAIESYKKALALDGKNYVIMTGLAGALIKTGACAESVQYSRLALNTNGNYVPAIINLAIASIHLGDAFEGEKDLLRARTLEPGNKQVLYNLALLYENQKRYPEACETYQKLAGMGSAPGLIGLGRVLEKHGKSEDAKKLYRDILASTTADPKTKQYANDRLMLISN
ncbi:MAG: tetratricopeptide repeat protein [Syntrophorhabdus sp.]